MHVTMHQQPYFALHTAAPCTMHHHAPPCTTCTMHDHARPCTIHHARPCTIHHASPCTTPCTIHHAPHHAPHHALFTMHHHAPHHALYLIYAPWVSIPYPVTQEPRVHTRTPCWQPAALKPAWQVGRFVPMFSGIMAWRFRCDRGFASVVAHICWSGPHSVAVGRRRTCRAQAGHLMWCRSFIKITCRQFDQTRPQWPRSRLRPCTHKS